MKRKKGVLNLALTFIVIMIIAIVVFSFSVYMIKKFFRHATIIRMGYDERTEQEIERLLDDGSRIAIPFDKKTIENGKFETFGIGVLNILNIGPINYFNVSVVFNKAFDKRNVQICDKSNTASCGHPDKWLETVYSSGKVGYGVSIAKRIKNNEQEKFLLMVEPKDAPSGTYIFDLNVTYLNDTTNWLMYDTLHKLYVDIP